MLLVKLLGFFGPCGFTSFLKNSRFKKGVYKQRSFGVKGLGCSGSGLSNFFAEFRKVRVLDRSLVFTQSRVG